METKTVKLYSLDYNNVKTYLAASLFILGNLALPQLFHLIPQAGKCAGNSVLPSPPPQPVIQTSTEWREVLREVAFRIAGS